MTDTVTSSNASNTPPYARQFRKTSHTFGSVAGDLGFSELTISALLGHAAQTVTQGYVHIDEALKLAVTRTCEEIAKLLDEEDKAALAGPEERLAA